MFSPLALVGSIGTIVCGYWYLSKEDRKFSVPILVVCVIFFIGIWFTPSGETSGIKGNWFIVNDNGGKTMRHWVLESYVKNSSQSDGWQFTDINGNTCYVPRDAFVMQINQPLADFLKDYKVRYNIPTDQVALK